ncbi:MAG: hypothetical protein AB1489_33485, partial [Acidobacteriota bacterium]
MTNSKFKLAVQSINYPTNCSLAMDENERGKGCFVMSKLNFERQAVKIVTIIVTAVATGIILFFCESSSDVGSVSTMKAMKAIDQLKELCTWLVSIQTAAIGGMGFLFKEQKEKNLG